ncbi:MAG: DsbA family protein, partial [Cyclobacteriaceae bacterium]|nr:DsbA family protein [Cyclobacteriaceae bacterium]
MDTKRKNSLEIIEFTDPACTWCWGSEPILRKLQYRFGEQLKISFVIGGLVEDAHSFMDPRNNIGGDLNKFNKQVGEHWLEASERHGMPVEAEGFKLFDDNNPSTYPMNIAYKAAQMQDEVKAVKFLRRMREAIAAEAKQANKMEVLIELAQDSGLDISQFVMDMDNGEAIKVFEEDRQLTASYWANGFPS